MYQLLGLIGLLVSLVQTELKIHETACDSFNLQVSLSVTRPNVVMMFKWLWLSETSPVSQRSTSNACCKMWNFGLFGVVLLSIFHYKLNVFSLVVESVSNLWVSCCAAAALLRDWSIKNQVFRKLSVTLGCSCSSFCSCEIISSYSNKRHTHVPYVKQWVS